MKAPYSPPSVRIAGPLLQENILVVSHEGLPVDPVDPEIFEG